MISCDFVITVLKLSKRASIFRSYEISWFCDHSFQKFQRGQHSLDHNVIMWLCDHSFQKFQREKTLFTSYVILWFCFYSEFFDFDHNVIKIKELTVKKLTLEKLWSQNHKITCDKKVLPPGIFERRDHKIAWSHCDQNQKTDC